MRIGLDSGRRAIAAAGIVLVASALGGSLPAQEAPSALVMGGDAPDLFLLYSGDVIGYLEPCG